MHSFRDQVVLITGAANGIGRRLTELFLEDGAKVAAVDHQAEALEQFAGALSGKPFRWRVADVTDAAALRAAASDLEGELGHVDVLVANAGMGKGTPAADFRPENVAPQIQVNLIGVANSIAAVLPGMLERRRGHLVALSSLASFVGLPHMAAYCASKAGVSTLMDALRLELTQFNVATSIICPGWIRTELAGDIDVPQPQILELDDAVRRIMKAIRARKRYVAFPWCTKMQLRLASWLPRGWRDVMLRWRFRRLFQK